MPIFFQFSLTASLGNLKWSSCFFLFPFYLQWVKCTRLNSSWLNSFSRESATFLTHLFFIFLSIIPFVNLSLLWSSYGHCTSFLTFFSITPFISVLVVSLLFIFFHYVYSSINVVVASISCCFSVHQFHYFCLQLFHIASLFSLFVDFYKKSLFLFLCVQGFSFCCSGFVHQQCFIVLLYTYFMFNQLKTCVISPSHVSSSKKFIIVVL